MKNLFIAICCLVPAIGIAQTVTPIPANKVEILKAEAARKAAEAKKAAEEAKRAAEEALKAAEETGHTSNTTTERQLDDTPTNQAAISTCCLQDY